MDRREGVTAGQWGTRAWFEHEFRRAGEAADPWGHEWRGSQQVRYERLMRLIAPLLDGGRHTVLDVGCSFGALTQRLAGQNPRGLLVGLDLSEKAAGVASRRLGAGGAAFVVAALPDLPLAAERFDLAVAAETLYYLPESARAEAVASIWRLLRPSGCLVFSTVLDKGARYFTPASARALMEQCCRVEQVEYGHDAWFAHWETPWLDLERRLSRGLRVLADDREFAAWQAEHADTGGAGRLDWIRRRPRMRGMALIALRASRAFVHWLLGWRCPVRALGWLARALGRGRSEVVIVGRKGSDVGT
jgi:SAM-dependent methyltransferase